MFVKYGSNSYMNLENVQMMVISSQNQNKIIFLCNHTFTKNPGTGREQRHLFPVESDFFPSKEEAEKWLKIYVEAYSTGKLEKQPDYWD